MAILCALPGSSATMDLYGTVTRASTGLPLSGVVVRTRLQASAADTTGMDGNYRITLDHPSASVRPMRSRSPGSSRIAGGAVVVDADGVSPVSITICNAVGAVVRTVAKDERLAPGEYRFSLSSTDCTAMPCFVLVRNGAGATVHCYFPLHGDGVSGRSPGTPPGAGVLAKAQGTTVVDTMVLSKSGYAAVQLPLQSYTGRYDAALWLDTVVDIDGNVYHTVTIGTQVWMVENLMTTRYNDSTPIPLVTAGAAWASQMRPAYCWFNNDPGHNRPIYGALYNWYAVATRKLAPAGWHVATDREWTTLGEFLGGPDVAGGTLKDTLTWMPPNVGATNASGFTARGGGYRYSGDGRFNSISIDGNWWTATPNDAATAWTRDMRCFSTGLNRQAPARCAGQYVRCIRD